MSEFLDTIKKRRSVYGLSDESSLPDKELAELLGQVIYNMPSAYNMQSQRMVLLLGDEHKALWNDIVLGVLREVTPPEKFPRTEKKIATFAAGHGTVMFFDDSETTERVKAENPNYADTFTEWVMIHGGMLQYSVWAILAEQGMGASLQHYNPIIDDKVKTRWNLPKDWRLLAEMPFGVATAPAGEKEKLPLEERFKVFGMD